MTFWVYSEKLGASAEKQCEEQLAELTGIIPHFTFPVLKTASHWKPEFAKKTMSMDNKLREEGSKSIMSHLYKPNY